MGGGGEPAEQSLYPWLGSDKFVDILLFLHLSLESIIKNKVELMEGNSGIQGNRLIFSLIVMLMDQ